MKIKLLISFLCIPALNFAQTSVNWKYYLSPFIHADSYVLVNPTTAIDQEASGANLTWNFNNILEEIGNSSSATFEPTNDEITDYPGTDAVINNHFYVFGASESTVNKIFFSNTSNTIAITGITLPNVSLSYTNTGSLGNFPLEYGDSNSDVIAGTFTGYGSTGTFTGTLTTSVDAYGLFSQNINSITNAVPVTRLKIVQQVSLFVSGIPVGNATQTSYYYDDNSPNSYLFKSTITHITAPYLNINDTTSTYEVYGGTLSTFNSIINPVNIVPNPVADVLQFSGNTTVTGVTITDLSGKTILQTKRANNIPVQHLAKGIYNVSIQTENGLQTQKMIKQ